MSPLDVSPEITFGLRPSLEELGRPIDEVQAAWVWRELALLAVGQLQALSQERLRDRERVREALDALRDARRPRTP